MSRYPEKRCGVKGHDKVLAETACPIACGSCFGENPCIDPVLGYAPLRDDLGNVACVDAEVQSGSDVTKGAVGFKEAPLDPIPDYNEAGMCTVNVHWHLGAEHRSEGEYDESCDFEQDTTDDHRRLRGSQEGRQLSGRKGHMCCDAKEMNENHDALVANEYDWKYCTDMHVGLTYEIHWPHSSLGHCNSEWQYQEPFMDGVLCKATIGSVDITTALEMIGDRSVGIGVEGQVFTIVNSDDPTSSEYMYPAWDALNGWNTGVATDTVAYQGSTTGDAANNDDVCRGTGGAVTWHVDRGCHRLEAATMDNLCRQMLLVATDDMSIDVAPHGARETVSAELQTTVEMA